MNTQCDTETLELKHYDSLDQKFFQENIQLITKIDYHVKNYGLTQNQRKGLIVFIDRYNRAKIVNGVAPISTGVPIDKDRVVQMCKKYDLPYRVHPKFSGIPVKFNDGDMRFTAVFFKSGKINIVGLKNDSADHLNVIHQYLKQYQYDLFDEPIFEQATKRLANRVYTVHLPKLIDLSKLYCFNKLKRWRDIKYNSQSFPGAVLKFPDLNSKALLFKTGSVIYAGIVSVKCRKKVLDLFLDDICEYLSVYNKE